MTDATKPALGLSVGATTLTAVTADRTVTRRPVLAGLALADFVDRVGDPVGVVAPDGSRHAGETLLAEALRALAHAATEGRPLPAAPAGRPLPAATAVTHPAHWRTGAVEALRRALYRIPEWSTVAPLLIADTSAAATALQASPGLPTRGVVALCDLGGSGTSITLLDAAHGYRPVGATVRHPDFSGDLVDRGLLAHVVSELSAGGGVDLGGTSAIGSLSRLRAECRAAKERLSTVTVTALPVDLPGFRGDVRLNRAELDAAVDRSLADLVAVVQDTLSRAGVRPADLAAVATVGGGAAMPVLTTTFSQHLRVPVVTTGHPAACAAIGAALRAARGPAAPLPRPAEPEPVPAPVTGRRMAWSQAAQVPDLVAPVREPAPAAVARPALDFEPEPTSAEPAEAALPWYRRPLATVAATLLVIVAAGVGTFVAVRNDGSAATPAAPAPSITTAPEAPPPAPRTVYATPAPVTEVVQAPAPVTRMVQAPPVTTEAAAPPPVTEPEPVVSTEAPPPPAPVQLPAIPGLPKIPEIPFVSQLFPQLQAPG